MNLILLNIFAFLLFIVNQSNCLNDSNQTKNADDATLFFLQTYWSTKDQYLYDQYPGNTVITNYWQFAQVKKKKGHYFIILLLFYVCFFCLFVLFKKKKIKGI